MRFSRKKFLGIGAGLLASRLSKKFENLFSLSAETRKIEGRSTMLLRKIPSSGETIPAIGLGTWQTFDVPSDDRSLAPLNEVLQDFLREGGSVIDSSPMYGRAEETVGILSQRLSESERRKIFLATKVWTKGEVAGRTQIEASFRKMKSEKIDLFQIHNLLDTSTHLKTLRELKEKGKIRYIGLTHFTPSAFAEMERIAGKDKVEFLQIPYSILTREAENRLLPFAAQNGIAVLVNRPFEEGGLFRRTKGKVLPEYFKERGCDSFAQAFLKYIISHPAVTCVIPATAKLSHLQDNIRAGFGNLPESPERKRFLSNLLEALE
ncbi:oxidoreductase, aldo/keto reductase family protein [Leptospira broomii serovar Hurstbridge str. 5399]|uniref:Oxidoreductase, aldo/keto reductase family protein n=2 Tax=Leptospira broomii TaxID=301541 RepID=T0FB88_9LEPT|nr:oxidoreductase, aldo/keto reductase family protein [Leptospira broomii serovar Hurstbridge str. 5399]